MGLPSTIHIMNNEPCRREETEKKKTEKEKAGERRSLKNSVSTYEIRSPSKCDVSVSTKK